MNRTPSSGTTVMSVIAHGPAVVTVVSLHATSPSRRTITSSTTTCTTWTLPRAADRRALPSADELIESVVITCTDHRDNARNELRVPSTNLGGVVPLDFKRRCPQPGQGGSGQ